MRRPPQRGVSTTEKRRKFMGRAIWKGHISFGLVSIPVMLFAAERRSDLSFHLLDKRNRSKIHYARINDTTGQEVPWEEVVKAYEYDKGNFVVLEEKDFKNAAVESSQTIEIENFVPENSIDPIYFDKPYYLVPEKKGAKGYVLLREILRRSKKVGIAKVVIRTRQYLSALLVVGDALVLNLLRFSNELQSESQFEFPHESLKAYKISDKEIKIAERLVKAMTSTWKPKTYHDDYREALMKLIEKKEKGLPIKVKTVPVREAKVIDFMSLLKKSIAEKKAKESKKPLHKKRAA